MKDPGVGTVSGMGESDENPLSCGLLGSPKDANGYKDKIRNNNDIYIERWLI